MLHAPQPTARELEYLMWMARCDNDVEVQRVHDRRQRWYDRNWARLESAYKIQKVRERKDRKAKEERAASMAAADREARKVRKLIQSVA